MTSHRDEQRERKSLSGSTSATTYFHQSQVAEELEGTAGRWGKPSVVVGQTPAIAYPRLPSTSPWHSDIVPPEKSLGFDISAQEPVGTAAEIEASLAGEVGTPSTASALVAPVAPASDQSPGVVETGATIPLPKLVRRRVK
jgi:hypothetical protein